MFQNGEYYKGNFECGKYNGIGKFVYLDGSYFEGSWKNNKKEGNGKEFDKNGGLLK